MQRSRRGFLAMTGAGLLAAGCSTTKRGRGSYAGPSITPTPSPTTSPTPETVVMTQWVQDVPSQTKAFQDLARDYVKAHGNVQIKVETVPSADFAIKLATAFASGSPPDLAEFEPDATIIKAGNLVAVDKLLAGHDFLAAALETVAFEGKHFGLPISVFPQAIFYRKSMLAAAKVDPPRTLDELVEAARATTKGDRKGIHLGHHDAGLVPYAGPIVFSAGRPLITSTHRAGFDHPRVVKAVKTLNKIFTSGWAYTGAEQSFLPAPLQHGQVAMQLTQLDAVAATPGMPSDIGVVPFPALDSSGQSSVPVSAWTMLLTTASHNHSAAMNWLRWSWLQRSTYLREVNPTTVAPITGVDSGSGKDIVRSTAALTRKYGRAAARPDWTPPMSQALSEQLRKIADGHDAGSALHAAASVVNRELKKLYD